MNQMLVAIFDTETAALKGLTALRDLHKEGGISLYASALIVKDETGRVSVKQKVGYGPAGAAIGLIIDSLVGALVGPAGWAVGASLGLTGLLFHLEKVGVAATFLDDVSKTLTAGKAAVLAEVEESWTSLVDDSLQKHGGIRFRRFRCGRYRGGSWFASEHPSSATEGTSTGNERAVAKDKAAIEKDLKHVKKQIKNTQDQAEATHNQAKAEMDARIRILQNQAKKRTTGPRRGSKSGLPMQRRISK